MGWEYGRLVTEVYELDKPIGHSFGDVEYYLAQLREVGGPVCEPAVGTGRILIPLLEAGLEVEGADTSPEMLAVCRQHCQERGLDPVLRQADMTTFARPGAYRAVIIPAGSIGLLDGRAATMQALRCFHQSLMPGGRLIVDVDAPALLGDPGPMRYWRSGSFTTPWPIRRPASCGMTSGTMVRSWPQSSSYSACSTGVRGNSSRCSRGPDSRTLW